MILKITRDVAKPFTYIGATELASDCANGIIDKI